MHPTGGHYSGGMPPPRGGIAGVGQPPPRAVQPPAPRGGMTMMGGPPPATGPAAAPAARGPVMGGPPPARGPQAPGMMTGPPPPTAGVAAPRGGTMMMGGPPPPRSMMGGPPPPRGMMGGSPPPRSAPGGMVMGGPPPPRGMAMGGSPPPRGAGPPPPPMATGGPPLQPPTSAGPPPPPSNFHAPRAGPPPPSIPSAVVSGGYVATAPPPTGGRPGHLKHASVAHHGSWSGGAAPSNAAPPTNAAPPPMFDATKYGGPHSRTSGASTPSGPPTMGPPATAGGAPSRSSSTTATANNNNSSSNKTLASPSSGIAPPGKGPVPPPPRPSGTPAPRIDPTAIPRPRYNLELDPFVFTTKDGASCIPPPAMSHFIATDTGNANPRFMRPSMHQIPATGDLLSQSHIPLGVVVHPLADVHERERMVEVVDFGDGGPIRCNRCKAYINPFSRFKDGGATYTCNFCLASNDVPRGYQAPLDQYGRRRDLAERPELSMGSVDFAAPASYLVRAEPQDPTFVFVVDVSSSAITSGATEAALEAIRFALDELPSSVNTRVGIVTFDTAVQFYNVNPRLLAPGLAVCADVDDAFCPLPTDSWLPYFPESRPHLDTVLNQIPKLYGDSKAMQSCFGAAMKAVCFGLQDLGGRVIAFQGSLPTLGEGRLQTRETPLVYGDDDGESGMMKPAMDADFYTVLAESAAGRQVSVDLFVCSDAYCDVATTSTLSRLTGGQVRHLPHFHRPPQRATEDEPSPEELAALRTEGTEALVKQIVAIFRRSLGFEAVMKVRVSKGLRVAEYMGSFHNRTGFEADLAGIDSEKALAIMMLHDGSLKPGTDVYIQAALLYTTPKRQRRVRVHTLSLGVTSELTAVFRNADYEVVTNLLIRRALQGITSRSLQWVETDLTRKTVDMLYTYRKFCSGAASAGQLILPESLKLLPLMATAIFKTDAFSPNAKITARINPLGSVNVRLDARAACMARLLSLPVSNTVPFIYPRLFSLHDMAETDGLPAAATDGGAGGGAGGVGLAGDEADGHGHGSSRGSGRASAQSRAASRASSAWTEVSTDMDVPINLPPLRWPSVDHLSSKGAFVLEAFDSIWVRLGDNVRPDLVKGLFLCPSVEDMAAMPVMERLDTPVSTRVWAIIDYLQSFSEVERPVLVVTPHSPRSVKRRFAALLVEDTNRSCKSYVDLLCNVHTEIQNRFVS